MGSPQALSFSTLARVLKHNVTTTTKMKHSLATNHLTLLRVPGRSDI